ncbi:hypothetical protein [Streptomyces erythrochromogenes]|uniref:hypothetical protein n=1 Tax=Streptomyces erythrochromogenes TaxID=285574 RepID=UPI003687EF21
MELPRGAKARPTARINLPKRTVLVQAVGGSEQGLEHALSLVQRIEGADYTFDQRLVLLEGNLQARPADHLDHFADPSPVGVSDRMDAVSRLLKEGTPWSAQSPPSGKPLAPALASVIAWRSGPIQLLSSVHKGWNVTAHAPL